MPGNFFFVFLIIGIKNLYVFSFWAEAMMFLVYTWYIPAVGYTPYGKRNTSRTIPVSSLQSIFKESLHSRQSFSYYILIPSVNLSRCCRGNSVASRRHLGRASMSTRPDPGRISCAGDTVIGARGVIPRDSGGLAQTHPLQKNRLWRLPVGLGAVTARPTRLGVGLKITILATRFLRKCRTCVCIYTSVPTS